MPEARPSLHWVEGVNFELTYDCHLACAHCLQADLRAQGRTGWANPVPIHQAIHDARTLGFVGAGINFTGGEILRAGSPLPPLLETTAALGIPVRVNTNGWWGHARHIRIGSLTFTSAEAVIDWLQASGVALLALSHDRRYLQYPALWRSVATIIARCEQKAMHCELNITYTAPEEIETALQDLRAWVGWPLRHCSLGGFDLIDLGGAAVRLPTAPVRATSLTGRLRQTDCQLRGFYRPAFLHVAPDGGVRSCMMAAGSGWLGHLHQDRLTKIANRFADNRVVRWFAAYAAGSVEPDLAQQLQRVRHPCALAVTVVRRLESSRSLHSNARFQTASC